MTYIQDNEFQIENPITNDIVSSYAEWDEINEFGDVQLYDAILAVDTPKFKKGDKVGIIVFIFSESKAEIYRSGYLEPLDSFGLKLSIVPL
jgi:hypothetical protein